MRIHLNNKYIITSDAYGYSLHRIKKHQTDNTEYTQSFAHFGKIEEAFTRILEQDLRDSEATEICRLLAELKSSKKMVVKCVQNMAPYTKTNNESPPVIPDFG